MKRVLKFIIIFGFAAQALAVGQGADASKVLALVREALGGDKKLAAVKTLTATGRSTKVNGDTSMPATDYEVAIALPDKFMQRQVVAVVGPTSITRTSGFNGDAVIETTDMPPALGGGAFVMKFGPGAPPPGVTPTPDQLEAMHRSALAAAREEFAQLTLGMFATSFEVFPLEFSYAGQAESPDGKAEMIGVVGRDGFQARLFADGTTHLPLMLTWMAKEPLVVRRVAGPGPIGEGGKGPTGQAGDVPKMTPEQRDQLAKDLQNQMADAESTRRTVEYRVYYGDYQEISGVKLPFRLQRSIDGHPTEELILETVKVNPKIDPKKFEVTK